MTLLLDDRDTSRRPVTTAEVPAASGWVDGLRTAGQRRFDEVGYPTSPKLEAWRHTQLRPIVDVQWRPATPDESAARAAADPYRYGDAATAEVVVANGRFVPALSHLAGLPRGVTVAPLFDAGPLAATVKQHLGSRAKAIKSPFTAINQASLADGVLIHVARGVMVERPIHVIFASTPAADGRGVSHPRLLVVAEDGAHVTVVETYVGNGKYLTNAVAEVIAGSDAVVERYKVNEESPEAFHVATLEADVGGKSTFISTDATTGSRITRNDLNVRLGGQHSTSTLNGLVLIGGEQHVDNHTLLEHAFPDCPSYELYKHVLDGRASGIFKGQIYVHPVAQKTDAKQNSKTLLLSDAAQMNSQPALEIYADDVKCTHGSTTGPVDESLLFYLRTRGLTFEQARQLLVYAFAADVTRRIKVDPIRARLESFMAAQTGLPQDFRIQELAGHDQDIVY